MWMFFNVADTFVWWSIHKRRSTAKRKSLFVFTNSLYHLLICSFDFISLLTPFTNKYKLQTTDNMGDTTQDLSSKALFSFHEQGTVYFKPTCLGTASTRSFDLKNTCRIPLRYAFRDRSCLYFLILSLSIIKAEKKAFLKLFFGWRA